MLDIRNRRLRTASRAVTALIFVSILISCGTQSSSQDSSTTNQNTQQTVDKSTIIATVTGSGTIQPAQSVDLSFQSSGIVSQVLVDQGSQVNKGQALAVLDTRDYTLQVTSAQAALDSAKARLNQLINGNSRASEFTSAQAQLASAQAQLASAQARLADLRNPSTSAISSAELQVTQAETSLLTTRDNSSSAKTRAEIDLAKASETLLQAQSKFVNARDNWTWVQEYGTDPSTGRRIGESAINTYRDTFVSTESAVRSAEQSVTQSQISLENARSAEIANITQAEQTLKNAQVQLDTLRNPTTSDISAAVATVEQNLASVASAQSQLDQLIVPGTESDIAIQQAAVTQAEQSLAQARLKLENATLTAPFAGTIATVSIVEGQVASGAAVTLINRDPLRIDLALSENDIVTVSIGDSVQISLDAIDEWSQTGTITSIDPVATTSSGVVAYTARVDFSDNDPRILVGMTANLTITTDERTDVLSVPNSALLPNGSERVVQVVDATGQIDEVIVTTGITDGIVTEIVSGLTEGQEIIVTPTERSVSTNAGPRLPFGR